VMNIEYILNLFHVHKENYEGTMKHALIA
jgi:hypothetical protein